MRTDDNRAQRFNEVSDSSFESLYSSIKYRTRPCVKRTSSATVMFAFLWKQKETMDLAVALQARFRHGMRRVEFMSPWSKRL